MLRKPIVLLGLIFVLGLAIGLVVSRQKGASGDSAPAKQADPDVTAEDLELVQGSDGKVLWKVRAQRAQYSLDQRIVQVIRPQLSAFIGEDRQEVFIKSDTGEVNQQGNTLTLRDNISGRYGDFALTSDVFDYIGAMKKVYLKGRVVVTRPDFAVNATTVEIDLNTRELVAAGGVSAELVPASLESLKKENKP